MFLETLILKYNEILTNQNLMLPHYGYLCITAIVLLFELGP